ncbi:ATP-dependent DNA helicase PIF1-like [Olea europaea var. sylvestris]|uniref:ATP-dependent DNA helicase PIF1-like n=1 Tax=Olea europaea var. sylvestris TaxID=158386 RepID=UPI000C1D072F|nr:ATP-dependent DNA helicase PIF1-like [Olea europaea var. sylvestris]
MIDTELFEGLEYIARSFRNEEGMGENKIWGGIQLVVSGDFFQLPPVLKKKKKGAKKFAFEADCWNASFDMQIELTKPFRQLKDKTLIRILQGIRKGECDPGDLEFLEGCCSGGEPDPSAVRLYPRIEDVNKVNKMKMESLKENIVVYSAIDLGEDPWKRQLKHGIAPDELELCKGARVMLTKNKNPWRKLVNGATGTVKDFSQASDEQHKKYKACDGFSNLPVVEFDCGIEMKVEPEIWTVMDGDKVVAVRRQIPLILSWALSIHKCQGMTLDKLHTDLKRVFDFGMVYVALSRIRLLRGLHLAGFDPSKIKAHPKVLQFYSKFSGKQDEQGEDSIADKN